MPLTNKSLIGIYLINLWFCLQRNVVIVSKYISVRLHGPQFDFTEDILLNGVAGMVKLKKYAAQLTRIRRAPLHLLKTGTYGKSLTMTTRAVLRTQQLLRINRINRGILSERVKKVSYIITAGHDTQV